MTGKPGLCIGTLGPGVANIAGAMMCAKVENSPVIFLGGQRARITERRVRRGRIQFVRQEELFAPAVKYSASIEYADQTDEIVREAIRRAMSTTPGPAYIEYPSHVILEELDVADPLPPSAYRLVNHGAGAREIAAAAKLVREAKNPILLVGHGVHTSRTAEPVRELAELMACPVIQTSPVWRIAPFPTAFRLRQSRPWSRRTCASRSAPSSASRFITARRGTGRRTTPHAGGSTSSRTRRRSA
jgi:thiamine pyrophosphate-dependent acetolactate synthase large subunit-like protein